MGIAARPSGSASVLQQAWAWLRDTLIGAFEPATFLNGARIIILAAVPFALGIVLHSPVTGLFAALGAIFTGFSDLPGSYRRRAIGLGAVTLFLAACVASGTLLQFLGPWDLLVLLFLGSALAFIGTLTANAGKATTFALVLLILAGGIPGDLADVGMRGLAVLAGGAWMMFGSLTAWPLTPFTPARKAVQAAFARSADVVETALAGLSVPRPDSSVQANALWRARMAAYEALDHAMMILTDLRAAREGTSMTGRRLVLALQQARLLTLSVTALVEVMQRLPEQSRSQVDPVVATILRDLARDVSALGQAVGPNVQALAPRSLSHDSGSIEALLSPLRAQPWAAAPAIAAELEDIGFTLARDRKSVV